MGNEARGLRLRLEVANLTEKTEVGVWFTIKCIYRPMCVQYLMMIAAVVAIYTFVTVFGHA